jgi:hypothetical protein
MKMQTKAVAGIVNCLFFITEKNGNENLKNEMSNKPE